MGAARRTSGMEYWDRADAGRILAEELAGRVARPCVVAAVPRGGVVVALPIAERLSAPLTVAYARKLASPGSPGSAFGVMDEDGRALLDADRLAALELSPDELESLKAHVSREIQRQMLLYCMPPLARALPGPAVVLVDDGLVTGLTMAGAVAYARRHGAREITVVASCASSAAADRVRPAVDRFVCPIVAPEFRTAEDYYADFSPVSDEEVLERLARARSLSPLDLR